MSTSLLKTITKSCLSNIKRQSNQIRLSSKYKVAVIKSETSQSIQIEEKKRSKLAEDEVRIQVHYCSLNSGDIVNFKSPARGFPFMPGYEFAGEVIEVGKKITKNDVLEGEKVAALNLETFGGFAEECVVNIKDIFRLPSNVQPKDAAVIVSGHSAAMFAFSRIRELKETDYVLVTAGSAGLGLAAIDVAANVYNAKVIGVVDSAERAEVARDRGAFKTVLFTAKLPKHVLGATENNQGVNIIYDAVGEHMLESIGQCLAPGGSIFHVAPAVLYKTIPAPRPNCNLMVLSLLELRHQNIDLYRTVVNDTLELADSGAISAFVSAKYNFNEDDINKAIEFSQEKKTTGKILIKVLN